MPDFDKQMEDAELMLRLDLADILDRTFGKGDDRIFQGDPVVDKIIVRYKKYESELAGIVMKIILEDVKGDDDGIDI